MAKYSLGAKKISVSPNVKKKDLYLDVSKADSIVNDMIKQLDIIQSSLTDINNIMNRATKNGLIAGSCMEAFSGWSKKAKAQASIAMNKRVSLESTYNKDVRNYDIKLLSDRISALEVKISNMFDE